MVVIVPVMVMSAIRVAGSVVVCAHWSAPAARRLLASRGEHRGAAALCRGRRRVVGGVFLLRLGEPGRELGFRYGAHGDRHVGMILAADLVAAAVVDPWPVDAEPGFDDAARDGIALNAERRDEEAVDHVGAGGQDADVL